jgi:hypothetical protein
MNKLLPLAQLIYSSWIISGDEDRPIESIPTHGGVLDYALRDLKEQGVLPDWASNLLHFVVTNTGLVCLELPQIQKIATEAKLTSDPNPSYTRSDIEVSLLVAQRCLARLSIAETEAKEIGDRLRTAIRSAERGLEPILK